MVLTFDPAVVKPIAYSVFERKKLKAFGKVERKEITPDWIKETFPDWVIDVIAVEGQYQGPNARVFQDLVEVRTEIQVLAKYMGLPDLKPIHPKKWQMAVLPIPADAPRKQVKLWSKFIAAGLVREDMGISRVPDEDESDAINIGYYTAARLWELLPNSYSLGKRKEQNSDADRNVSISIEE